MGLNIAIVNPILRTPYVHPPFVVGRPQVISARELPEVNIVELGCALGNLGHRVTIYVADAYLEEQEIEISGHVTVRAVTTRMRPIFNPALVPFTPSLVDSKRLREADVIQSGEFHQLTTFFASRVASSSRIPLLVWQETYEHMRTPGRWYEQLFQLTGGQSVRAATSRFIPRTTRARSYLQDVGVPDAAIGPWIPTGIDGESFQPRPGTWSPEDFGFERDCILVTVVARLNGVKGVDLAIRALAIVRRTSPNVGLLIRGSGPDLEYLKGIARQQGVEDRVRFIGPQSRKEMANIYNSSDIFLLPSRKDLFPFSLLEAGSCGLPSVATRVGCIGDFVTDGVSGVLVPPNSDEALARGISRLLVNDELRETMGRAAHQRFVEDFDIRVTAPRLSGVYQEAVEHRATLPKPGGAGTL